MAPGWHEKKKMIMAGRGGGAWHGMAGQVAPGMAKKKKKTHRGMAWHGRQAGRRQSETLKKKKKNRHGMARHHQAGRLNGQWHGTTMAAWHFFFFC
ncbi:hypothetical protein ACTMQE_15105 [Escherichia coli]